MEEKDKIEEKKNVSVPVTTTMPKRYFECSDCGLSEEYDYYGTKPPFCKSIVFEEESYVSRDPFSNQKANHFNCILLGSKCGICAQPTCQSCSLFFTQRFCSVCSQKYSHLLPEELRRRNKK